MGGRVGGRVGGRMGRFVAVFGPGLVVMLADTDVGSVITAGQSGVRWGYHLLPLQFALIPVLYIVQELTVRLGIFTGRGHGELIRATFGPLWAWVAALALGIATTGALLTEFSGVAGVGELYGLSRAVSLPIAAGALLVVVITGAYRRVERVAIAVGLFEFAFFFVAWTARPDLRALIDGATHAPYADKDFLYLAAANIGAVVTPWMIFYQQSAVADKRLDSAHFAAARCDTAAGAVIAQFVMAAVLIACAATIGRGNPGATLASVGAMSQALTPFMGTTVGNLVFGMGVLGAGMVAAIVCSLAFAWGLGEVAGYRRALEYHPLEARWFYGAYASCVVTGAALVGVWPDLVSLSVGVQVMNALLLPIALGLLIALSMKALPRANGLSGWYLLIVLAVSAIACGLGVAGWLAGLGVFG